MDVGLIPDVVPELLWLRSQHAPERVAFYARSAAGSWLPKTWAEYWSEVDRLATALHARGLEKGDHLAILLPTCPAWELTQQAALLDGAVIVGLDPRATREELAWILRHAQVNWLVLPEMALELIPADVRGRLRGAVVLADARPEGTGNLMWWKDLLTSAPSVEVGRDLVQQRRGDDVATILYTSGTTGEPKGIEVTHGQIMVAVRAIAAALPELTAEDTTICWLPMAALFQRMANLVFAARGMATYFVDDPRRIMEQLAEIAPSFFIGVPRFYEKLDEWLQQTDEATSRRWRQRVKVMISGSAPLTPAVLQRLRSQGLLVLEAYGLTENTVPMAMNRLGDYRFGSVGKPLAENDIRFDADGELLVRGPGLFRGYYREQTPCERFTADGYYRTGDCGHLDADGFLYLVGRKSELIKTSTGRRISPVAIEAVYAQSPYVDQVVVVGDGRKHLVALLTLNLRQIESYLRDQEAASELQDAHATALVKELMLREIERREAEIAPHDRVQAVAILSRPFSPDRGEVAIGGKLKRAVIGAHCQPLIDRLYAAQQRCVLVDWESP